MNTPKEQIAIKLLKTIAMLPNVSTYERGIQIKKALIEAYDQGVLAGKEEMIEKCRKIYIDGADWAEWGMSDDDAGEKFDEEIDLLSTPQE